MSRCKRCKGRQILVVDNGFHYIYCPDCHPAYHPEQSAAKAGIVKTDSPNVKTTEGSHLKSGKRTEEKSVKIS